MNTIAGSWLDALVGTILAATFFMPPMLAAVGWSRWRRTAPMTPLQNRLTVTGLILNTIGAATTVFMILATVLASSMGGGPSLTDIGRVSASVIGVSVVSTICGLWARPGVR